MKGKVILELEEYEALKNDNKERIAAIHLELKELKEVRDHIDANIIKKVKYWDGTYTYYIDTKVQELLETVKKNFIKKTSILKFILLKR